MLREISHRRALDVDRVQCLGIFGLECAGQTRDTLADFRVELGIGLEGVRQLAAKRLDRPIGGTAPAKLIDRGVPQRSVEPRYDTLVLRCLIGPIHDLGERILQNVLRQLAIADAAFEISEESAVVLEQRLDGCLVQSGFDLSRSSYLSSIL